MNRHTGVMISKYSTINLMCYSWDSTLVYFPFLLTSCPSAHLSISEAKSLSSEHPQKPSTTTTTTIKHLAVERPVFVFTKNVTNPMEPHSFLLTNQIRAFGVWLILGWIVCGKVLPLWPASKKCNIMFCLSVHLANYLMEPRSLKKCSILYVLVKFLHLSASPHLYLFSEIELLQGNGNRAECCGTSFSHTTTV